MKLGRGALPPPRFRMKEAQKDDPAYVGDIRLEISRMRKFTHGMTKAQFMRNELVCHAVERCIEIIGEAARNVSEEFRQKHPQVEWKKIIAMRNLIIHAYGRVDYNLVWEVVEKDIAELEKQLDAAAKEEK